MPLPSPVAGAAPPPVVVCAPARDAILDDDTVDLQVRVAVLHLLEKAADAKAEFERICDGEAFFGPAISDVATLITGRALTVDSFQRGLRDGWFDAPRMLGSEARDFVSDLRLEAAASTTDAATYLAGRLPPAGPHAPLSDRVTWHYFDRANPTTPMVHVAPDLATRLALPSAPASGAFRDYIVFEIPGPKLVDLRRPRFTDCADIGLLNLWRPGGRTAPKVPALTALWEGVDRPTALGHVVTAVKFVTCRG